MDDSDTLWLSRVLVVDDQADGRHLLRTLIEQRGGHLIDGAGASAALAALALTSPHVLIADLAMPDVDGFGLIASVRQRTRTCLASR